MTLSSNGPFDEGARAGGESVDGDLALPVLFPEGKAAPPAEGEQEGNEEEA
jgi:hypothetical protein